MNFGGLGDWDSRGWLGGISREIMGALPILEVPRESWECQPLGIRTGWTLFSAPWIHCARQAGPQLSNTVLLRERLATAPCSEQGPSYEERLGHHGNFTLEPPRSAHARWSPMEHCVRDLIAKCFISPGFSQRFRPKECRHARALSGTHIGQYVVKGSAGNPRSSQVRAQCPAHLQRCNAERHWTVHSVQFAEKPLCVQAQHEGITSRGASFCSAQCVQGTRTYSQGLTASTPSAFAVIV